MFSSPHRLTDAPALSYVEAAILDHTSRKYMCGGVELRRSDAAFLLIQVRNCNAGCCAHRLTEF